MPVLPPAYVALHLIACIEAFAFDQTFGEAEGHGGIIGPLAGLETPAAAADHVRDGREAAGRLELEGGADRIAYSQADERAANIRLAGSCLMLCAAYYEFTIVMWSRSIRMAM